MKKSVVSFVCMVFFVTLVHNVSSQNITRPIVPGACRPMLYLPAIKNKNVALVANHTSVVGNTHLLDTLLSQGIKVVRIFCPEHGFRGNEDAGAQISSGVDSKTGIPVVSLYGKKLKPSEDDLKNVDVVLYDLQDVGVRFYTYISTLTYVMEACGQHFVPLFILDRPNPNGFYVDGPVLDLKYKSFVGMHPIPVVYGMTAGELAMMINEEGWLPGKKKCEGLGVIPCQNYSHKSVYQLPVHPSPNLQTMSAVYLYPSLCLFEGTSINVGRGTDFPFLVYGSPSLKNSEFTYTPQSIEGKSKNPLHEGQLCHGVDLRNLPEQTLIADARFNLEYLLDAYKNTDDKKTFFNSYFENLAGTGTLRAQIIKGDSPESIRKSWQPGLDKFKVIRKKYLLYEDF